MSGRQQKVVIVGGGFSGLGVAIALLRKGMRDFVILEQGEQLGGTWRDNTYPGCACDVPSHFYSFSFEPKADWSRVFAEQAEIQEYLLAVAQKHGVMPFVEFECGLLEARWIEGTRRWLVRGTRAVYESQYLVACHGPLHEPRIPDLPGLEQFRGEVFHSARWNHDYDLTGKRVAVIGSGSSAIQFVPKIQPQSERLFVFQRTAPWVLPKPDYEITSREKAIFRRIPILQSVIRRSLYGASEVLQWAQRRPERMKALERIGERHLERQVKDPVLREKLRPDFALGCKRLLLSNTWYPAIQAENAELISCGVKEITADGVIGDDGIERSVDAIIFGTGFHVTDASVPTRVYGTRGRTLASVWAGSPQAYLGTTVRGFPNMFLLIGPNMGNGHGSAFVIIEAQTRYLIDVLKKVDRVGIDRIEVRESAQEDWNANVQDALRDTVWNAGGCKSWYIDRNGRNSTIYPWSTFDMRARLRRFDMAAFDVAYHREKHVTRPPVIYSRDAVVAITGAAQGIGFATAELFITQGARVAIGDIEYERALAAAARLGDRARAFRLDVTTRPSFEAFVANAEEELGPIDVLVNNAGIMPSGCFLEEPDDLDRAVMAVNHWGTSLGMKIILPKMILRGRGHVVNVASLAGKFAVPYLTTYVASKHATVGLSASVRAEIDGTGVTISTIMPTAVRTRLATGIELDGLFAQEASDVARAIVRSVRTRAPEITVPELAWPVVSLYGLLPRRWLSAIPRLLRADRILGDEVREARTRYETACVAQGQRTLSAPAE